MKKYISITALLVAGSVFANAEDNLLSLNMVSSWSEIDFTVPANDKLTSSNSGFTWAGGANLTESWKLTFDWAVGGSYTRDTFELFGTNGDSNSGAYGVVLQYKNGELHLSNRDASNTYASISNITPSTNIQKITIAYLKTADVDIAKSTLFLQVGEQVSYGIAPESDTDFLNNNGKTRLWTNGAKDQFTGITLHSASAVIPEPSAFGLLAGLGALALVGARRRRR